MMFQFETQIFFKFFMCEYLLLILYSFLYIKTSVLCTLSLSISYFLICLNSQSRSVKIYMMTSILLLDYLLLDGEPTICFLLLFGLNLIFIFFLQYSLGHNTITKCFKNSLVITCFIFTLRNNCQADIVDLYN